MAERFDPPSVVEVRLWGARAGALTASARFPGYYAFEYDRDFVQGGVEPSPLLMPSAAGRTYTFQTLAQETYHGLPGLIADALPDHFGNALIDEYLNRHGYAAGEITTLQRLIYVGRRAMGALEFKPAASETHDDASAVPLEMSALVEDARRALRGELSQITPQILEIGSSAGGARAKAVIGWNRQTGEVVSGQFDVPEGFEHWLLKFDVDLDGNLSYTAGFGRIEYAHYLMAREAGVEMNECRLMEEGGRAHFMTRRFDRRGNRKLHIHSLCGLAHLDFNQPRVHSYEQYLRTIQALNIGKPAIDQAFVRCAFNVAAVNCDDHTKNLAFLLEEGGDWQLTPAYDVCFSHNPAAGKWTREHQMRVNGKTWDIEEEDLLALAKTFGVSRARERLDRVIVAVRRWREFAGEAGVPEARIAYVEGFHPAWVKQ
ncbi:hypothetical protein BJI67_14605 [Acidihalobacter aeolianus]|uniref:Phosphatidylinositol kinase n=1 Tax=Acidihalobacter aeolianus TaxID=2792603 RepID=A0A1D8KAZ5_9GAMM|nr:type II toxin-antitoxin system HipA family toxin [Acidihalobacter aeolianus]AOV18130.1 hypothetical protein BJI67_14605 [Acidihalobacter aeolianus]